MSDEKFQGNSLILKLGVYGILYAIQTMTKVRLQHMRGAIKYK